MLGSPAVTVTSNGSFFACALLAEGGVKCWQSPIGANTDYLGAEIDPTQTDGGARGAWHPVEFQQASPPVYQRAVWIGDDGKVLIKPKLVADLKRFAKVWDRNLREQGFLKAAQEKASSNNREQEEE